MKEDEMAGWHHRLNGREFESTPGDGDGSIIVNIHRANTAFLDTKKITSLCGNTRTVLPVEH